MSGVLGQEEAPEQHVDAQQALAREGDDRRRSLPSRKPSAASEASGSRNRSRMFTPYLSLKYAGPDRPALELQDELANQPLLVASADRRG